MDQDERIPGWYGKIPGLGDFASRRLPPDFVSRWDAWLQGVIAASRERLGAEWLAAYLHSPVWRFLLFPGACGEAAWIGVLMPSVDKVGRYFPLTVAASPPALPGDPAGLQALSDWHDRIEMAALATLDVACSAQQFDSALSALPLPVQDAPGLFGATPARLLAGCLQGEAESPQPLVLQADEAPPALLVRAAAELLQQRAAGRSLWWCRRDPAPVMLMCCGGLPGGRDFAAMLQPPG